MKLALAILASCAVLASANRNLLQDVAAPVPAPEPAPEDCPAPKSPGANCVTQATQFQGSCASFITTLNSATGGKVVAKTDAEIQALVQQLQSRDQSPSANCCTAAASMIQDACVCSSSVQAVAKAQQNLSPSDFQTVAKVFLAACGQPSCYDTCRLTA